jgi:hypothetical protein
MANLSINAPFGVKDTVPKFSATGAVSTVNSTLVDVAGKVGIGVPAPASNLDVNGTIRLGGTAPIPGVSVDAAGNVGIGKAAPAAKLDVVGLIQMTGFKLPMSPVPGSLLTSDGSGNGTWQLAVNGTPNTLPKFTGPNKIDDSVISESSGNIGIGTTTPGAKLDVNGNIQALLSILALNGLIGKSTNLSTPAGVFNYNGVAGGKIISGQVGVTEKFSVDDSGNVVANGIIFPDGTSLTTVPSGGGGGSSVISESGGNVGIGTTTPQEKLTLAPGSDSVVELGTPTGVSVVAQSGGYLGTGTYYFRIVAMDGAGGTTPGSVDPLNPTGTPCAITNPPNSRCHLTWDPVVGATAYRVYRIDTVTGQYHYFVTPDTYFDYDSDTGATLDPNGVPNVTTAYLNIIAASGPSWLSGGNVGIGTTSPQEKLSLAPDSHVVVEMTTPTGIAITPQSGGGLALGADYYFRVVAEDGAGGLTTGSLPEMRYRPPLVGGNNSCRLSWNAVHGAKNYRVYIGNTAGMQNRYFISPTNSLFYINDNGVITMDPVTNNIPSVPDVTTAYVNKLSASGPSWFLGGNVGIGTTNPTVPLQIKPGVIYLDGSPGARVYYINNGTTRWAQGTDNGEAGEDFNLFNYSLYQVALSVSHATNRLTARVGIDSPFFNTTSSKRWKKNIQTIKGALSKVKRLRGISYDQKENDKCTIGLVAEEVGEVIPEIVTYEENGKDARGLDYSRLVAVLIEAVKEQQGQIEELKDTVKFLLVDKNKVSSLA